MALSFPALDPVALAIGPVVIRWYALAYIAGIVLGWKYAVRLAIRQGNLVSTRQLDDFVLWATIGVILGGRLGYVLLYQFDYYRHHLGEILHVWQGGMAFHGGLCGVVMAAFLFARAQKIPFWSLTDILAVVAPIGLFFGRLANFVNGELYGRVTQQPWGIVFPQGGAEARHPSQLYEAALEGIVLILVMGVLAWKSRLLSLKGRLTGVFLLGYAIARLLVEQFREPDAQIGLYGGFLSQGQLLSLPMLLLGLFLAFRPRHGAAV
jgi:phosphatidylglycerol---prolipoprotein diacylglyceryl transferase